MRVLMVSKACLIGAYQRKLEEIAAVPDVALTVVVPPEWRDPGTRTTTRLERAHLRGYQLVVERLAFNGSYHLHFYPGLRRWIEHIRPDVVHLDEEPYNFATWHGLRLACRSGARTVFFSWQNLMRRYPPPFRWLERDVLHKVDYAMLGSRDSLAVWRAKGYTGPAAVLPQFGIDPELFSPDRWRPAAEREFVVGYAGRLVPEKGIDLLLRAIARLPAPIRLRVLGSGPAQKPLQALSVRLGIQDRVAFEPLIPSTHMPDFFRALDAFVLPSRSRPNWKEQFGRVLVEAMACGVAVVGSTCGEIPNVVGDAGLIFPEEEVESLTAHLQRLCDDPALRHRLARRGRERAVQEFSHRRIAAETVRIYREVVQLERHTTR